MDLRRGIADIKLRGSGLQPEGVILMQRGILAESRYGLDSSLHDQNDGLLSKNDGSPEVRRMLSVLVPVFNEHQSLRTLYQELAEVPRLRGV